LCQGSINAWSLLMADPVLKPVELIPVSRDSFPRCSEVGSFNCGLAWVGEYDRRVATGLSGQGSRRSGQEKYTLRVTLRVIQAIR